MSSVEVSTLDNGLTVVSDTMETVETVTLGAWVNVGTRNEAPEVNGVSHLLEHMAFKGTRTRSARQIAEEIEAVGGQLNAYTSRENTAYYAKVLKEDTGLAFNILGDILRNSTMDDEELTRERTVVLQEINQSNDTPDDIIFDHFQETAYPDQPMGRPVLGRPDIIGDMSRATVMDYMTRHYGASSMTISAAGRIAHKDLVKIASEQFGDLADVAKSHIEKAAYTGGEFREERDLEQVHLVLGFEGVRYDDPDFYALAVFSALFGGGMSSRLFQEVREQRGLAYSVYSFASSYVDSGLFGIYAGTGEKDAEQALEVICDEIKKARASISEDEVQRARAQLKASILMALESTTSRCEQKARQLQVFGRIIPVAEVVEKVEAIDVKAVLNVINRLSATVPTFAALGPITNVEGLDSLKARLV